MDKAKFAFGSLANLSGAIQSGAVDKFDLLCLMDEGVARIGWMSKDNEPVLISVPEDDVLLVDALPETGKLGIIYIMGEVAYLWTGTQFIVISESTDLTETKDKLAALEAALEAKAAALEAKDVALEEKDAALEAEIAALKEKDAAIDAEVAKKADAEQVAADIEQAEADAIAAANAYTDKLEEEVVAKYVSKKYEIAKAPIGTLVDYFDKEIRVMVPEATDFANLNNAIFGDENTRYIECRIYAPEGAVGYKVDFSGKFAEGKVEDFANTVDEHGRAYFATVPPIAGYDAQSAAWVYYGASSTTSHYVGWDLKTYWYDENGVMIESDSIRINLSNEDCHFEVKPYYVGNATADANTYTDEKIEEVYQAFAVVEF